MIGWLLFTLGLSIIFGYYFFEVEADNKCLVKNDSNYPEDARLSLNGIDNITNVSDDFDLLFSMLFV